MRVRHERAGCEVGERWKGKGRQVVDVVQYARQSRVDHRLRIEAVMRA